MYLSIIALVKTYMTTRYITRATIIIVGITFLLILIPVEKYLVNKLIKVAFYKFNGYVNADIPMYIYFATIACGILVYMVDRWILTRRIKKINMTDVLKDR